ncbi:MAG: ATP-binding protein [Pyrinomonadaceae bacterium]
MNFFNTFRGRLLLVLALMLIATLGVQFYLNYRTQQEDERIREEQGQTLVAAITLGFASINLSDTRMEDLLAPSDQSFLDEPAKARVRDILIIDNEWEVYDSLNPEYLGTTDENGDTTYKKLSELTDLPPLMEGKRLGSDLEHFPNSRVASDSGDVAHAIPIETSKGRWYVMVLLHNDKKEAAWRAAQPLIFTLGILLIATLISFYLVWRFTRPIANLSNAARRVAAGDLAVRVPDDTPSDEMGRLTRQFNEMTAELEKKHDLETQLQHAERSAVIGRLGSAIAHEIRNPLNYINLTLDHLRSKFSPADGNSRATFEKLTSQLKTEVARINGQITDFLNYSRPARANLQPIDVRDVIDASLRIVEAEACDKNIKIGLIEHERVQKIIGDAESLRSVFNNLFINATQSMGSIGGHLNIKISPDDNNGFVRVEVSDTGAGISEENLEKIFEPYFSTKETGTGLGLAIVQKLVDTHKGTISVESRVGEGTKFTVRLPSA